MNKSLKGISVVTMAAAVAFVAFIGFTTFSVKNISRLIEESGLSTHNGIPGTWDKISPFAGIKSQTYTENKGGYLQYTTIVENRNESKGAVLTHISSYYLENGNSGFVPFSANNLEYSYSPNTKDSWNAVSVSAPSADESGFKLNTEINLSSLEGDYNTVYFRYIVSPGQDGTIVDKTTLLAKNSQGQKGLIVSEPASIAYEKPTSADVVALSKSVDDDPTGEASFAEPLGATSDTSAIDVISSATLGNFSLSTETTTRNIIIIIGIVGAFALCLIAYLIIATRANVKKKKSSKN